jgi:hypothetical protein
MTLMAIADAGLLDSALVESAESSDWGCCY